MAAVPQVLRDIFASPLLFPKKAGAELQRALPFAEEVYGPLGGSEVDRAAAAAKADSRGVRAQRLGRVLHVYYHSIPDDGQRGLKILVLLAAALVWLLFYPAAMKLRCFACAVAYSFAESAFTLLERGKPYTSAAQFVGNLLYIPVLLDAYGSVLGSSPLLYVLLFPFNVWLLEAVVGYAIVWVHGYNVAWCYLDYADEFLHGNLRLGHGIWWWGLGAACLVIYPPLLAVSEGLFAA